MPSIVRLRPSGEGAREHGSMGRDGQGWAGMENSHVAPRGPLLGIMENGKRQAIETGLIGRIPANGARIYTNMCTDPLGIRICTCQALQAPARHTGNGVHSGLRIVASPSTHSSDSGGYVSGDADGHDSWHGARRASRRSIRHPERSLQSGDGERCLDAASHMSG